MAFKYGLIIDEYDDTETLIDLRTGETLIEGNSFSIRDILEAINAPYKVEYSDEEYNDNGE